MGARLSWLDARWHMPAQSEFFFKSHQSSEGRKVYTKGVFSSENSSASAGKKRFGVYQKARLQGKKKEIHIHQRAFKVFVTRSRSIGV